MGELEDELKPDFIVHVHGESERIASFIKETSDGGGPLRVQPLPWQEIVL